LSAQEVDYAKDVQPILEQHCYDCHGRMKQKSGLRLDQRAAALAGSSFGEDVVLVPGSKEDSLLWEMITLEDPEERMPPEDEETLTAEEIALLGAWIAEGVSWPDDGKEADWPSRHWSYQVPEETAAPSLTELSPTLQSWPRNALDRFLLAPMTAAGLQPQPSAAPGVLLRRLSLDLTGLPPTLAELDAFETAWAADADTAYAAAMTRLMASPHYGEKQAQRWLDLARYADSNGYEKDEDRSMWPYRDWVIDAYNQDLGFDQFTIEQLAGDLLPEAQQQDLVATGFHRNTMTNNEGGTDEEEFRVAAVKDRADTTAAVWLGSTMACAKCHNHKYDPFTQRDYYQLFAYFNQTADGGKALEPMIAVETPRMLAARKQAAASLTQLQQAWPAVATDFLWVQATAPPAARTEGDWTPEEGELPRRLRTAEGFQQHFFEGAKQPLTVYAEDRFVFELQVDAANPTRELFFQFHLAGGDWEHRAFLGEDLQAWGITGTASRRGIGDLPPSDSWQRILIEPAQVGLQDGAQVDGIAFGQFDGTVRWGAAGLWTRNPDPLAPLPSAVVAALQSAQGAATTLVLQQIAEARTTHLLEKGSFLSPGVEVAPAVPSVLRRKRLQMPEDRLALAKWLVDGRNPLTARVEVNRVWQQVFGIGLVATVDDFGAQGEPPSHPELLDWLAVEFMAHDWSRKWLLTTILDSAAYRQGANTTALAREVDPQNRLLSHYPRLRMSGEGMRDQCLALAGLLTPDIGGPSVHPPQPAGIDAGTYAGDRWRNAMGPARHRRGLYTFWRRTSPYPTFVLFDATSRELSCARRDRSDTPLQALALLNDPAFVEATVAFAARLPDLGIDAGFRLCTGRLPSAGERQVLQELQQQDGWESVARVLFNLDETLNRG